MQRKDKQIKAICEAIKQGRGIDYRYDHFRQKEAVPPPFLIYRRVAGYPFSADDKTYFKDSGVDLELYAQTPEKMAELMEEVEALLDERGIFYTLAADTVYIDTENFYETLYEV